MAQEGVIVQITHCFILKYKKIVTKCNISVKARDRKMNISIEWPLYILGYKYVAMLQLSFEALVFFSFSISPILFCSQVIGDEFCSHFCCSLLIFVK